MLVLGRKEGQVIEIGDDILVKIIRVGERQVKVGVLAPPDVSVHRQEVAERIRRGKP